MQFFSLFFSKIVNLFTLRKNTQFAKTDTVILQKQISYSEWFQVPYLHKRALLLKFP